MRLTLKQKAALVRLLNWAWRPPGRHGKTAHARAVLEQGWSRTVWSLSRRGLVRYVHAGETDRNGDTVSDGGYELTPEGLEAARELAKEKDPKVMREASR